MSHEQITEREQAVAQYCANIEAVCSRLDHNREEPIPSTPWPLKNSTVYEPRMESISAY